MTRRYRSGPPVWQRVFFQQLDDLLTRTAAYYVFVHPTGPVVWPEAAVRRWLTHARVRDLRVLVAEQLARYPYLREVGPPR